MTRLNGVETSPGMRYGLNFGLGRQLDSSVSQDCKREPRQIPVCDADPTPTQV